MIMVRTTQIKGGNENNANGELKNPAFDVIVRNLDKINGNRKGQMIAYGVDELDVKMIGLILSGMSNENISKQLKRPLSTIQRRKKKILDNGLVHVLHRIDFRKFGLRKGLLYFKCKSANLQEAVDKISRIRGVESASAYLGSLDVIAFVAYSDSKEVLEIIAKAQELGLISDVTWSEEIHSSEHS